MGEVGESGGALNESGVARNVLGSGEHKIQGRYGGAGSRASTGQRRVQFVSGKRAWGWALGRREGVGNKTHCRFCPYNTIHGVAITPTTSWSPFPTCSAAATAAAPTLTAAETYTR